MKELESIWSGKTFISPEKKKNDIVELYHKIELENLQKRQSRIFTIKAVVVVIIIFASMFLLYTFQATTNTTLVFYSLFLIETIAIFILNFKLKFSVSDEMYTMPAQQFADKVLKNLKREKTFIKIWLPMYVSVLIVQVNLFFMFSIHNLEIANRLILHSSFTVFTLFVFSFSLRRRIKRYNIEIKPLVDSFDK